MWYERSVKAKTFLNGGEGQQGRMSTSRVKPSPLEAKQSTDSTLYRLIYFHKGCSAGFQPILDGSRQVCGWWFGFVWVHICTRMWVYCAFQWRERGGRRRKWAMCRYENDELRPTTPHFLQRFPIDTERQNSNHSSFFLLLLFALYKLCVVCFFWGGIRVSLETMKAPQRQLIVH